MSNLFLNIYSEAMDFTIGGYTPNIIKAKSYMCSLNNLNIDKIGELRTFIMKEKGDWLNFKYSFFNETYYVDVNLIFHNKTLTVHEDEVVQNVILLCEEFLLENKFSTINSEINNSDRLSNLFDLDGFILSISENGGGGALESKEIEKIFNENCIKYEALNISKSSFDGGASGVTEKLLYFIISSAASGLTWDIIKPILVGNIAFPLKSVTMNALDKYNFNILRKVVADRIREEEKNIILIELHKKNSKLSLEFRAQNIKIYITCDDNYNIIDFKLVEEAS